MPFEKLIPGVVQIVTGGLLIIWRDRGMGRSQSVFSNGTWAHALLNGRSVFEFSGISDTVLIQGQQGVATSSVVVFLTGNNIPPPGGSYYRRSKST